MPTAFFWWRSCCCGGKVEWAAGVCDFERCDDNDDDDDDADADAGVDRNLDIENACKVDLSSSVAEANSGSEGSHKSSSNT